MMRGVRCDERGVRGGWERGEGVMRGARCDE